MNIRQHGREAGDRTSFKGFEGQSLHGQGLHERAAGSQTILQNGLTGWLLRLWQRAAERRLRPSQLALIERISLGPKHVLALVEAEGMHVLVATSAEGAAAFYPLHAIAAEKPEPRTQGSSSVAGRALRPGALSRVSW